MFLSIFFLSRNERSNKEISGVNTPTKFTPSASLLLKKNKNNIHPAMTNILLMAIYSEILMRCAVLIFHSILVIKY